MITRTRYQYGSLQLKMRTSGRMMWELRYYETDAKGERQRRTATVGSLADYPTESAVRKSPDVQALLLRINSEAGQPGAPVPTFGVVVARYEMEEMPERYSTSSSYKSNIKIHIRPRWAEVPLVAIKTLAVEDWLKALPLAPKTKAHIRSLMHMIFQCARRWEMIEKNPVDLVRVRGCSKRLRLPRVLTPEEFCSIPSLLKEPYRTQVCIAGCLGLRASEIMPLQWSDLDFAGEACLCSEACFTVEAPM